MRLHLGLWTLLLIFAGSFYVYYTTQPIVEEAAPQLAKVIEEVTIQLAPDLNREAQAEVIANAFGTFSPAEFVLAHRSMQWDAFNDDVLEYLVAEYNLTEREQEIVATHSEIYLRSGDDILTPLYQSGEYTFVKTSSAAEVAASLLQPMHDVVTAENLKDQLASSSVSDLLTYIDREQVLLPDLLPLPPQDMGVEIRNGVQSIVFSTIYYNAGRGNLELRGDPSTIYTVGDFDRDVFQRLYNEDGTYRDHAAGTFTWHNPHLHYHFADFVTYEISHTDGSPLTDEEQYLQKSTFCVRDVTRVDIDVATTTDAHYRVCGRERQGITVGWGDAYFYSYTDQSISVPNLPSGDYRLTFDVNPEKRFEEITLENNIAWTNFRYNQASSSVTILDTFPSQIPDFEHIYIEQNI